MMRMLTEDAFQEEREAAGKWRRAQLSVTQLSTYFVGFQEHLETRRRRRSQKQGAAFNLKRLPRRRALPSARLQAASHVNCLLDEPIQ